MTGKTRLSGMGVGAGRPRTGKSFLCDGGATTDDDGCGGTHVDGNRGTLGWRSGWASWPDLKARNSWYSEAGTVTAVSMMRSPDAI